MMNLDPRYAEHAHDRSKELQFKLIDAATRDAQEAMKVALAINGGAAIAVLAFLGAVASREVWVLVLIRDLFYSLFWFAAGVFSASVTAACAYFSNSLYAASHNNMAQDYKYPYVHETDQSKRKFKLARWFNRAGIGFAMISLIAFVVGAVLVAVGASKLDP